MREGFNGWYMKCQSGSQTIAVIPAVHRSKRKSSCSIQIVTKDNAWNVIFPIGNFIKHSNRISIGNNKFSENGLKLDIRTTDLNVRGKLDFGPLRPLSYDIMGPFALIPFMECHHSIMSMLHKVNGTLCINNQILSFHNAKGYWEGDKGHSFPRQYAWTHCFFAGGSIMLSVAEIPMAGVNFNGVICVVLWHGKEYRMATYLGAKVILLGNNEIRIVQGEMELYVRLLETTGCALKAPVEGKMKRIIHENVACRALYHFEINGRTVFCFQTENASFEYEYA